MTEGGIIPKLCNDNKKSRNDDKTTITKNHNNERKAHNNKVNLINFYKIKNTLLSMFLCSHHFHK